MITVYKVTSLSRSLDTTVTSLDEAKKLLAANPDATVKPIVKFRSCATHPSCETSNCPLCGTAAAVLANP